MPKENGLFSDYTITESETMQKLMAFRMEEPVFFKEIQTITGPVYHLGDQKLWGDSRAREICERIPVPYIKVLFTIQSSPNSEINAEIFLPAKDWSGRLVFVGNGGLGNSFREIRCIPFLYGKHIVAHCDLATSAGYDSGMNNSSVWADFGWRATHLTTVAAKQIAELVYGSAPQYSYCSGRSTGGQQCISAASYFPDDFDGIFAQVPGISKLFLHLYCVWNLKHMTRRDGSCKFTADEIEKISMVAKRYLKEKYSPDVPDDGLVLTKAYFNDEDRESILTELQTSLSFTEEQVDALRKIYEGPVNPRTGERIYPGFPIGAEARGSSGLKFYMNGQFAKLLFSFPLAWGFGIPTSELDIQSFDFDHDIDRLLAFGKEADTDTSDLREFRARGGKLIICAGAEDGMAPLENISAFYERVSTANGGIEETKTFCRYYIIPGIYHSGQADCPGTDWVSAPEDEITDIAYFGESNFSGMFSSLVRWVEEGLAPDMVYATEFEGCTVLPNGFTHYYDGIKAQRPVYPYPEEAKYESGDPALPTSYKRTPGTLGQYRHRSSRYLYV